MMKLKMCLAMLTVGAFSIAGTASVLNTKVSAQQRVFAATQIAQTQQQDVQFICQEGYDQASDKRFPTTYAWAPRGKLAVIRWQTDYFKNSGYTPERRCKDVASKFDQAHRSHGLKFIGRC
jgi:hypothetical protein